MVAREVDLAVHSPEGRADRAARRAWACARSSSAPIRATACCPRGRGSPSCPAARAWAPRACGGRPCCAPCARTCVLEDLRGNVDTRIRRLREGRFDAILLAAGRADAAGPRGRGHRVPRPARVRARAGAGRDRARVPRRRRGRARGGRPARPPAHGARRRRGALVPRGARRGLQRPARGARLHRGGRARAGRLRGGGRRLDRAAWRAAWPRARGGRARARPRAARARGRVPAAGAEPMSALAGRRVVVTRRAGQASTLAGLLAARGATVVEVPAIEIAAPADVGPLDAGAARPLAATAGSCSRAPTP